MAKNCGTVGYTTSDGGIMRRGVPCEDGPKKDMSGITKAKKDSKALLDKSDKNINASKALREKGRKARTKDIRKNGMI